VPPREFLFALELSDEPQFDGMLAELTGAVLAHVGYQTAAIEELRGVLRTALDARNRRASAGVPCDIRFHVAAGELRITVTCRGAADWHTTRPLP
jgi:hypothetical protein